jgi:hypothetical protein
MGNGRKLGGGPARRDLSEEIEVVTQRRQAGEQHGRASVQARSEVGVGGASRRG